MSSCTRSTSTAVCLLLLTMTIRPSLQGRDQKRLLRDLFEVRKYNVLERPVKNDSDTVSVVIGFAVQQIINLDEKDQYLESSVWMDLYWHDANLIWNPADYGGIYKIRLAPDSVWRPDILMYNSANDKFDGTWPTNVVVHNEGFITYIPPAMLRSVCKVNIRWFPYDEQFCPLKFGSWTYDEAQVNISVKASPVDTSGYTENGEFTIIKTHVQRHTKAYNYGVMEIYPDITLYFHLQRLALYYYFNLIIPAALISVMALLVFTLPVDSGEKMGLSVTILLSLTVFMMVVADFMPRTSEALPLLGVYFSCIMGICAIALIASVWVLNLHYFPHLNESPPNWIRYGICVHVAKLLRMTIPQELLEQERFRQAQKRLGKQLAPSRRPDRFASRSLMSNVLDMDDDELLVAVEYELGLLSPSQSQQQQVALTTNHGTRPTNGTVNAIGLAVANKHARPLSPSLSTISFPTERANDSDRERERERAGCVGCRCRPQFLAILKELRTLSAKVREDSKTDMIRMEWRFAARVIDRVCLILFSLFNIVCTSVVLFSSPPFGSGQTKPADWP